MEYNIGFTLGDPSYDGHCIKEEYHITANHSAESIAKAYKETSELLGFNLVEEVGTEYEGDRWVPEEFTSKLLSLGIIDCDDVPSEDIYYGAPKGCYELDPGSLVTLYFDIAKFSLPDLEWEYREMNEEILCDLEGAGYGLYHP